MATQQIEDVDMAEETEEAEEADQYVYDNRKDWENEKDSKLEEPNLQLFVINHTNPTPTWYFASEQNIASHFPPIVV